MAVKSKKTSGHAEAEVTLPKAEEARAIYAPALSKELLSIRSCLVIIAQNPPQLLHIEGGDRQNRLAMALWLAALLNCDAPGNRPCFPCDSCLRISAFIHPDILLFDGRMSSIKIGDVRPLHSLIGEKPHFAKKRIVIFNESEALGTEAANSLLKILEDPTPDTHFIFTEPQRECLLPTLISRGWVITLPQKTDDFDEQDQLWSRTIANFLTHGTNWFNQSHMRSSLDSQAVIHLITIVQKAIIEKYDESNKSSLGSIFSRLSDNDLFIINQLCTNNCDALFYQTNPAHVLDSFAVELYRIVHDKI